VSATTNNRHTITHAGEREGIPVAAATTIPSGVLVAKNAAGYAVNAADLPGLELAGISQERVDNSAGDAGDKTIIVEKAAVARLFHSGITRADEGKEVFVADNQTVKEAIGHVFAGRVFGYISSTEVDVDLRPAYRTRMPSAQPLIAVCAELDCENANETVQLVPARANNAGLALVHAAAIVTEVFAGGTEDQGIVTLYDSAGTSLNISFTATDGGADALNDFIQEGGSADTLVNAKSGGAGCVVGAGKGVYAKVTQAVTGTSKAGKMKVVAIFAPLAAPAVDA